MKVRASVGRGSKTAIFATFAYIHFRPSGARGHIFAHYSSNRFRLIQNRGEIASVSGYSRILGPQNAQNAKKMGSNPNFSLGADRARPRGARSALTAAKRPL